MSSHNRPVLLFLDFDGVLHHFFPVAGVPDAENQHFFFVPNFEQAVRALPAPVEIVISSTWRRKRTIDEIRALFSPDIAQKIVGITPSIEVARNILGLEKTKEEDNGPGSRQVEVEGWLKRAGREGNLWVGIDDFPCLYRSAAVVACQDKFDAHEAALLTEAVADPAAFAQKYPIQRDVEKRIIIVPASSLPR